MRQAGSKDITPEVMEKIWNLHTNSVKDTLIANTLGCSRASVLRFVTMMEMARKGEPIDSYGGDNHKRMKAYIKSFWGVKEEPKTKKRRSSGVKRRQSQGVCCQSAVRVITYEQAS